MFADLLRQDRERAGRAIEQVARRLGVPLGAYKQLEAVDHWPSWETYDRIAVGVRMAPDIYESFLARCVVSSALELDQDGRLVAHDPSLVSGRDPVHISCRHIPGGPVL